MCGIFGYVGNKNAVDIILNGLTNLEYRGYDSAGIATISDGSLQIRKSIGKLNNLYKNIKKYPLSYTNIGIGHTRWATHGKPYKKNAHPHVDSKKNIAIVHNGIIENNVELRKEFAEKGYHFVSETDSEVIIPLIKENYRDGIANTLEYILPLIKGSYAIGIICRFEDSKIVCTKKDIPLIIGIGENENFISSDIYALLMYTRNLIFLEDGDIAEISKNKILIKDSNGIEKKLNIKNIKWKFNKISKTNYKHFMIKEIFEQPFSVLNTITNITYKNTKNEICIKEKIFFNQEFIKNIKNIYVVACGTSYYAGLISKFWFEHFTNIPTIVDIASEFRYREPILNNKTLVIVISQSGETADTIAALKLANDKNCKTVAICNVVGSSISIYAKHTIYTCCGIEIGVASTKAFTSQLVVLFTFALNYAYKIDTVKYSTLITFLKELSEIPLKIKQCLKNNNFIKKLAKKFLYYKNFLFLGRYLNYPVALEGALKLKEVSYIHAEGCATGEIKHGTIALIDKNVPVIVIAIKDKVYKKTISNIEEIKARGAIVITIATECDYEIKNKSNYVIYIPKVNELLTPILTVIPTQLLAYYIANLLKYDVDKPRNLAKAVTVE